MRTTLIVASVVAALVGVFIALCVSLPVDGARQQRHPGRFMASVLFPFYAVESIIRHRLDKRRARKLKLVRMPDIEHPDRHQ